MMQLMQCGSEKVIYMDNNATTRIAPEVLEAMVAACERLRQSSL